MWSDLRSLRIIYRDGSFNSITRPPIPFSALMDLAVRCPRLECVSLANIGLPSPPSLVPRMEQSCVREVHLSNVVGEATADLLALALVMDRLFPNLSTPRYIRHKPSRPSLLSDRMLDIVAGIQAARRLLE